MKWRYHREWYARKRGILLTASNQGLGDYAEGTWRWEVATKSDFRMGFCKTFRDAKAVAEKAAKELGE
jgi:hypothetical protein